jgi:hypothetical protein
MTTNTDRPEADNPAPTADERLRAFLSEWWSPDPAIVSTLPKGGALLEFVSHAEVTRALIEVDPLWTWEPMGHDDHGQPVLERDTNGSPVGLWGWMTVCGVRRPCYGSCEARDREPVKILVGDLIRNGAMRFGCCAALWSAAERNREADKPAAKARSRSTAKPRSVTDLPVDTTGLPEPAPGTAQFQALALLAPAASAADLAAVLKAQGIEGRGALTDQATLDRARAAVVAKWPA